MYWLKGKNGASLTWTEMVRAQALLRGNKATYDLIDTYDSTGLQLLVKNASQLHSVLKLIEDLAMNDVSKSHLKNIIAIDLNFGCPSPDIIREGAGPALLKRTKKISEIFHTLVEWKSVLTTLPNLKAVGCKIRLGLNESELRSQ
mmetsp:Transcript_24897/g.35758  ORF Transcript_24897/g.35758 Transcript_24897/m.35758 type:complete len:145 (-) Transcript_24897:474-908(-)